MLWIPIDRSLDMPLIGQVYGQIRDRILKGELPSGEKLPSTRELSGELKVSRNVVLEAYDQLLAEGFLISRRGSGTFVAEGAYLEQRRRVTEAIAPSAYDNLPRGEGIVNFRSGIPALDRFPRRIWAQLSSAVWNEASSAVLGYDAPEGRPELRHVLARYLLKSRGVHCHPDQLVITSGATQALSLVSKLLLSPGDEVIMEDPITCDIQAMFQAQGASIRFVPVDEYGMQTALLPKASSPKFAFVTPSHQYPLGGALPIQRRIQLIQFARTHDCYLVEDDYDSEFRYEGPPVSSLQGLEPDRVLYIGSFSKILSPALRMGYLILPMPLVESCRRLKWYADLHKPSMDQLILARFMEGGYLERHIAKMKKLYKSRRDCLIECLRSAFPGQVNIIGDSTGLHLVAEFPGRRFDKEAVREIERWGVKVYLVEEHANDKEAHRSRLILGYGHLPKEDIQEGITRLSRALLAM
ncbi:PLP-dependent aminotransferase family protein [Paenibacillus oleatilyticus]|uniref:MocR-like pyridoxine biosynthesis transcription factor PdxR n=1 Tax=Paenibacillus oleatilyticus TaxID=2594886 RepID=UPI001C1F6446|nr:PLP-dependent aminotransferase family protein [Paenibacillus oleatilyticus]MBU7320483.1 PLP-dependent aminotransferase family protein [Paenibacillus oleatilyticus]